MSKTGPIPQKGEREKMNSGSVSTYGLFSFPCLFTIFLSFLYNYILLLYFVQFHAFGIILQQVLSNYQTYSQ